MSKCFNKSLERRCTKMDTEEYGCFFKWKNRLYLDFIGHNKKKILLLNTNCAKLTWPFELFQHTQKWIAKELHNMRVAQLYLIKLDWIFVQDREWRYLQNRWQEHCMWWRKCCLCWHTLKTHLQIQYSLYLIVMNLIITRLYFR